MFTVISIMFSGILIGYLMRHVRFLRYLNKTISWTILGLLLFLGITVGLNDTIIDNLKVLGFQALVLACMSTLGSVLMGWAIYRLFFKKDQES